MTTLQLIESLTEAYAILRKVDLELSIGPDAIWRKAHHAKQYIDSQISELLAEPEANLANLKGGR